MDEIFKVLCTFYIGLVVILWIDCHFIKNKLDDLERKIDSLLEDSNEKDIL